MKKIVLTLLVGLTFFAGHTQERFEVKKMGFSIQIPKDWYAMTNEEVLKNIESLDFTQADLNEILKSKDNEFFMATYTKYSPEAYSGIIPTIKINTKENPAKSNQELIKSVLNSTEQVKKTLINFKFEDKPSVVKLSNKEVVYFTAVFELNYSGVMRTIRSKSYYILKKGYYISVNYIEEIGKEEDQVFFDELVKSIQLND